MPTQKEVQQLIQSLTPSAVNNGNPNTAYNVAPPTTDTQGNWFSSNLPSAASVGALTRGATAMPSGWTTPPGGATLPAVGLPRMPDLGPWTPPAGWTPSTNPGTTPPVTHRPPVNIPARPAGTPTRSGSGGYEGTAGRTSGWGANGGGRVISGPDVMAWANSFNQMGLPVNKSTGQIDGTKMTDKNWTSFFSSDAAKNVAGNLADLFVPGNAYLSGTGEIDVSNIVTGLVEQFIPFFNVLPGNQLDFFADKLADYLKDNPDGFWSKLIPDVIEKAIKDHAEDNDRDKAARTARRGGGGGGGAEGGWGGRGGGISGVDLGSGWGSSWGGTRTGSVSVGPIQKLPITYDSE